LDAEFERVENRTDVGGGAVDDDDDEKQVTRRRSRGAVPAAEKTLLDLSLEADLNHTRVPFVEGSDYIDVKLAFMAELDGVSYGIAVPYDAPAAIVIQDTKEGSISAVISPESDEEGLELMEIFAAQLQQQMGEDIVLRKTPRVLTIEGPLDTHTKDWKKDLLPLPVEPDSLMDETNESLEFFHQFMKDELGEEEYEKTMRGEDGMLLNDELLDLFQVSAEDMFGDLNNDEDLQALMDSVLSPEENMAEMEKTLQPSALDHDSVALKLVSYVFPEGKTYSLVQLLKPYVLVGRYVPPTEDDPELRFELLSPEEERMVIPQLEQVCKEDLERVGLQIQKQPM
jgi:hypothetical protein